MTGLTHLDARGQARMVDVSAKPATARLAVARTLVVMAEATRRLVLEGGAPKGDVLAAARIAGIMAAKQTAALIPLCHPLPLSAVTVDIRQPDSGPGLEIEASATTTGPTGVEMEALTAAAVAALTLYDMVKAADRGMRITELRIVRKTGGRNGDFAQP